MTEQKKTEEELKVFIETEAQKFSEIQDHFDIEEAKKIWSIFENDYQILSSDLTLKVDPSNNIFNEIKRKIEKVVKQDDQN